MILPENIKNAAQLLGKSLRQDEFMRTYLEAVEEFQGNPEARQLEEQLYTTYHALIDRQQAGEQLTHDEKQVFNELRRQVQAHPVISKRDFELRLIKPHLAGVANEISASLGMDYTTLVSQNK